MHDFIPFTSFAPTGLNVAVLPLLALVVVWTTVLKGFALWHAARGSQKWWFIAILVINSIGILEIVYLIWFRPASSQTASPEVSSSTQAEE